MKRIGFVLFCVCSVMSVSAQARDLSHHDLGLLWQHRLVLVFGQQAYVKQKAELLKLTYEWRERDLVLIAADETGVFAVEHLGQLSEQQVSRIFALNSATLRENYTGPVVVLGKDGGIKLNLSDVIKNEVLFATIDVMPMRQKEMGD